MQVEELKADAGQDALIPEVAVRKVARVQSFEHRQFQKSRALGAQATVKTLNKAVLLRLECRVAGSAIS
jgi:hypothetical protein